MATVNQRVHQAYHGGATTSTANINGIAVGGLMSANINVGYDDIITAPHDGNAFPTTDRLTQFCRGTIDCQDWAKVISLLNGTTGTYIFYERESGLATVTKHTITAPVIHQASVSLGHRGHGNAVWSYECKAADETKGFIDMWAMDNAATAPVAITAKERSLEILNVEHGSAGTDIDHVTDLSFNIGGNLSIASQDGDVGYTAVDVVFGGIPVSGSITFQQAYETPDTIHPIDLLNNAAADLIATIKIEQGGSNKTLTILSAMFTGVQSAPSAGPGYTGYTMSFVCNGGTLTSATAITIA